MADELEKNLMLRARGGDRAAFEEIFRLFEKPVLNYLFRMSRSRAASEDLVQETFLRLWKALPGYEPTAKVSTYVFHIAHNLFLNDAARRREQALGATDGPQRMDPASDLQRKEVETSVKRAVEALPEGEREVLLLSEFQGFRYSEISQILGIPVGTVKSRMFSAVQRLRGTLKGLEPRA